MQHWQKIPTQRFTCEYFHQAKCQLWQVFILQCLVGLTRCQSDRRIRWSHGSALTLFSSVGVWGVWLVIWTPAPLATSGPRVRRRCQWNGLPDERSPLWSVNNVQRVLRLAETKVDLTELEAHGAAPPRVLGPGSTRARLLMTSWERSTSRVFSQGSAPTLAAMTGGRH